ncbi:MAG: hypothetical protein LBH84_00785 [Prevotellaceae bacterium]|nr:hypothetical protein [Prevotellaceae bacterium]
METGDHFKNGENPKSLTGCGNICSYILSLCIVCILFASCVTTANVSKSKDFTLTNDIPVSVQSPVYPEAGMRIEEMLLEMGYHVVPFETALNKITTDVDTSWNSNSIKGSVSTYNAKYIPAAVVISVDLSFYYPDAHFNFNGGYIRIFDMRDKKLLASFRYKAGGVGNLNDVCNQFVKDFKKLVTE